MAVRTTNGGTQTSNETASNKIMEKSVSFSPTTTQFAQFTLGFPKSQNNGTVTFNFDWLCTSTGDVVWGVQGVAVSDGDTFDATFGTAREVTDNVLSSIDLGDQIGVQGRALRLRRLVIQPGGVVPAFAPQFDWVVDVVNQCRAAGVPYYLKANLADNPGMSLPKSLPRRS